MADLNDVMRVLGRLEEGQKNADNSRRVIYEKLDQNTELTTKTASQLERVTFTLEATTDIAVQARNVASDLANKFEKEVAPVLAGVASFRDEAEPLLKATRAVRNWAALFAVLAGAGVISIGAILAFFNDAAKAAVRYWLGI